jgi:hypothetical protein
MQGKSGQRAWRGPFWAVAQTRLVISAVALPKWAYAENGSIAAEFSVEKKSAT